METFSALLALCAGNSPVTGEVPSQRHVTWSFDVFFGLRLIKRLSKYSRCRWLEPPWHSLWRHCHLWSKTGLFSYQSFLPTINVSHLNNWELTGSETFAWQFCTYVSIYICYKLQFPMTKVDQYISQTSQVCAVVATSAMSSIIAEQGVGHWHRYVQPT